MLSLALLAAAHHPDTALRGRVLAALDAACEAGPPADTVRAVLLSHRGTPLEPFRLDETALELAIRVVRLAFQPTTPLNPPPHAVRVGSSDALGDTGGLMIRDDLSAKRTEAFAHARRPKMPATVAHFEPAALAPRAAELTANRPAVQASLHADPGGFRLTLAGDLPWPDLTGQCVQSIARESKIGRRSPTNLGMTVEARDGRLHLRAREPEAILQFSGCLARGDRATVGLWGIAGRVLVRLTEFDGDLADVPALALYPDREAWLGGVPNRPWRLDPADWRAVAGWAYAPGGFVAGFSTEELFP